jgi:peptidoglycan/xylan/chitin deacetylase (PgdA/CDA1 family)
MVPNPPQKTKSAKRTKPNARSLQTMAGDIGHAFSLERFGPKFSEQVIWRVETQEPQIALTFDDGPHVSSTPLILEILEKHQVPATFFWVGKHLAENRETALSVLKAGHEVGNHTYSHPLLIFLTDKQVKHEIEQTDKLLRDLDVTGPKFLRPPSGFFNKRVLAVAKKLGYRLVVGDVYPRDSHRPGSVRITQRVLERTTKGSIIILHDGGNVGKVDRSQTQEALLEIIPELQSKGFEFVRLSTLLSLQNG